MANKQKMSAAWRHYYATPEYAKSKIENQKTAIMLERYKRRNHIADLMDCRVNIKTSGEHGYIPTPIRQAKSPCCDVSVAISVLKSGGILRLDHATKNRILYLHGQSVGRIDFRVLTQIRQTFNVKENRIPGTSYTVLRLV